MHGLGIRARSPPSFKILSLVSKLGEVYVKQLLHEQKEPQQCSGAMSCCHSWGYIGVIWGGLCRDNEKENGNRYVVYWGYWGLPRKEYAWEMWNDIICGIWAFILKPGDSNGQ